MKRKPLIKIYRNLHKKGMFSILSKGKVVGHGAIIRLSEDISFHVNENRRQKVLQQRKKNMHSCIKGRSCEVLKVAPSLQDYKEIWYNPYFTTQYYCVVTGNVVQSADEVLLCNDKAYLLNPVYKEAS